jgi:transcriptional regulator with XRE-family HTH domain
MIRSGLIKTFRKEMGLSQQEFADRVGVSRSAVYEWERGGYLPDGENLKKLASVLGVSVSFLLGESNDPKELSSEAVSSSTFNEEEGIVLSVSDILSNEALIERVSKDTADAFLNASMIRKMYEPLQTQKDPSLTPEQIERGISLNKAKLKEDKNIQKEMIKMFVQKIELLPPDQLIIYFRYRPFEDKN